MKTSLRKGTTIIEVESKTGWFSNNLYCTTSLELDQNKKTLILDFSSVSKSRIKTDSNDDLEYLNENSDTIKRIRFSDKLITEKLIKRKLNQNELITVKFISEITLEIQMSIKFTSIETFSIEKNE